MPIIHWVDDKDGEKHKRPEEELGAKPEQENGLQDGLQDCLQDSAKQPFM
jgi:hypothetical protein